MASSAVVSFFEFHQDDHPRTTECVEVMCRVTNREYLDVHGPSFLVKFDDGWLEPVAGWSLRPSFSI